MTPLDRPIILLGAARSGTTLFGDAVFGMHPEVAYWVEPRHVWRYGHAYRPTDVLRAEDATPAVARVIMERFARFAAEAGRPRFAEKTPSNCFAVPFIHEVLPDARFVHLVRDGRDVAASAVQEWRGLGGQALDSPELREGSRVQQVARGVSRWARLGDRVFDLRSALELPSYTGRLASFATRRLLKPSWLPWGPRFPGIRATRLRHSLIETCAIQWARSVEAVRDGRRVIPNDQFLEVRYEDFIRAPAATVVQILAFLELEGSEDLIASMTDPVQPRPLPSWPRRMEAAEVAAVERVAADALRSFGYALSADA